MGVNKGRSTVTPPVGQLVVEGSQLRPSTSSPSVDSRSHAPSLSHLDLSLLLDGSLPRSPVGHPHTPTPHAHTPAGGQLAMDSSNNKKPSNLCSSRRAPWATRSDGGPDTAIKSRSPGAAATPQGLQVRVRDDLQISSVSLSLSSVSRSSAPFIPIDDSTPPPAYSTIFPPSPPLSAASTSPSDSLLITRYATAANTKSVAAPALLSSPASELSFSPLDLAGRSAPTLDGGPSSSLLDAIFPAHASIHDLPSFDVKVDDLLGSGWSGCILDNPLTGTRTLYVGGGRYEDVELRDSVVDVIDRAEEEYGCQSVVLALRKDGAEDLGALVHQLLYIGCTVVSNYDETGVPNDEYLLLGMEI
ncbi:protein of ornithine decarboxylase antizyme family [Rhodotorula toruloides NP11]|uniref:Ornithine decarboxylase antizyme n=1 Tax=Rhodotorula toruloides (strain NP11) TaxID=1130832 RepID=M7WG94_RHOT1|nr:protein of ornithine decarboxylase antizyme family [Rhodotorula toruloides NP11]EMS19447.1 protein of ornithine decarboxylase antizyme family [Rhodotorula toruloides NP11]